MKQNKSKLHFNQVIILTQAIEFILLLISQL